MLRKPRAAAWLLLFGSVAAAQTTTPQSSVDHMSFDRPEAWALKYFTAVTTFTGVGPPIVKEAGSVAIGVELGWVPELDRGKRLVGFDGTALEDLNKTPLFGRPTLTVGLPAGLSIELAWAPPVTINGGKANLVNAAIEETFFARDAWSAGLRVYGQQGHAKGDYTCSKEVAAQPPGSPDNPLGCVERSRDTATLNDVGAALIGAVHVGGATLHLSGGATYNDVQFQVGAVENGVPDHTLLITHGWTGWIAGGVGGPFADRGWIGLEAFYSPLIVNRPPRTDTQNDGLFNVRAVVRYRLR
jgi:hypothetical protein